MTSIPSSRRFDDRYREHVTLRDGTTVLLRLLTAADEELLRRGFERLSPRSRYRRFLMDRDSLSPDDLRYLTHADGDDHVAIAAGHEEEDGSVEGLGVARFVRLPGRPDTAEPAVVVIDAYQNLGLGRVLLARLEDAAVERGIRRFRATVLVGNRPMLALLHEISRVDEVAGEDGEVNVEVELHEHGAPERPLFRLLQLAARGIFELFHPGPRPRGEGPPDPA